MPCKITAGRVRQAAEVPRCSREKKGPQALATPEGRENGSHRPPPPAYESRAALPKAQGATPANGSSDL